MEDSSQFMQWAVSTLQQENPPPPATPAVVYDDGEDAFLQLLDNIFPAKPPAREDHPAAANSCSSVDSSSGGGSVPVPAMESQNSERAAPPSSSTVTKKPLTLKFITVSARPKSATAAARAEVNDGVVMPQTVQVQHGSPSRHHIMAERKRRETLNMRFIELATVIPGLKKMDKATILSEATRYVKELQEKLKTHEEGSGIDQIVESSASVLDKNKKPHIAASDCHPLPCAADAPAPVRPEIEVRISDSNVILRIHCEDRKGVAVKVLAEVEGLNLGIVHANVMPFPVGTLIINIMAKVEGLSTTVEAIVGRLNSVLLQIK